MNNSNKTNVLNEDILTIIEGSSETTETEGGNIFNILDYGAIAYQHGIDEDDAKTANYDALHGAIAAAVSVQGIVKIPTGEFLLNTPIVVENVDYVKIVNEGLLVVDPEVSQRSVFEFQNCKNVYFEGGEIESNHDLGKVEYSPEKHTRVNMQTTMLTGISVKGCENVVIKNVFTYGLEYAVLIMKYKNNDTGVEKFNGNVTVSDITTEETSQPIFVADTRNVTIENAYMTSRASMGSGDHFIYCSRYVDNVYIKDCTFDYSDEHFGCAINLRNSEETADSLNNSVKFCRIDNVEVTNMYRQFVSAKADTRIICNNCKVTTRDNIDVSGDNNYIPVFFVGQRASIDIINCTVDTRNDKYMLASLCDNVQVNISHGKFTGLKVVGSLSKDSGNEGDFINLNVSFAEIETANSNLYIEDDATTSFYATFDYCNLFTSNSYFFQSKVEKCKIACYNCEFTHYSDSLDNNNVAIAYLNRGSGSEPLLENIKIINCNGDGTKGITHFGKEGKSTAYGNYFSYTENNVPKINSNYAHEGAITLNMLSPELQAVIAPLLTT